jgi:hypothetical protein
MRGEGEKKHETERQFYGNTKRKEETMRNQTLGEVGGD